MKLVAIYTYSLLLVARKLVSGQTGIGLAENWNPVVADGGTLVTTDGCGEIKGCMHYPAGCQLPGNCEAVLTWRTTNHSSFVDFELMAATTGYVAVGLSTDRSMVSKFRLIFYTVLCSNYFSYLYSTQSLNSAVMWLQGHEKKRIVLFTLQCRNTSTRLKKSS
jgi:hypothetical protein